MTTFTPPTAESYQRLHTPDVSDRNINPADRLFRYYDGQTTGVTVWRDPTGTYHQSQYPFQGGNTYTTYRDGEKIAETSDPANTSLADATEVYLGGHTYNISSAQKTALEAAGYGAYINVAPVTMKWENEDLPFLTNHIATEAGGVPTELVEGDTGLFGYSSGVGDVFSSNREIYVHSSTDGWTDVKFRCDAIDPAYFGVHPTYGNLFPQAGVCLRHQIDGDRHSIVALNNNIFLGINYLNVGVWSWDEGGTSFLNRQVTVPESAFAVIPFPYGFEGTLVGTVVDIKVFPAGEVLPSDDDTTYRRVVDLDTVGDTGPNPTPTGEGTSGIIGAHQGVLPIGYARLKRIELEKLS